MKIDVERAGRRSLTSAVICQAQRALSRSKRSVVTAAKIHGLSLPHPVALVACHMSKRNSRLRPCERVSSCILPRMILQLPKGFHLFGTDSLISEVGMRPYLRMTLGSRGIVLTLLSTMQGNTTIYSKTVECLFVAFRIPRNSQRSTSSYLHLRS